MCLVPISKIVKIALISLSAVLILSVVPGECRAQLNLTSNRYDSNRTAANLVERTLTTSNVSSASFGKLGTYSVEGAIFAQPLYAQGVNIPSAGIRNVLYVATMHDVVYAFDADRPGTTLWIRDFRGPGVTAATHKYGAVLGDALGVLSTPVIDVPSNRIFIVTATRENNQTVYRLRSIDMRTGADTRPSVVIQAAKQGLSLDTSLNIQRAGLVLANGQIYAAFSGNPIDQTPYHGWILTYDMNTFSQSGIFLTSTANGGSIWQSGGAPPVDAAGNVYYLTGNGFSSNNDGISNFFETLLKLSFQGGALSLVDRFTPSNWSFLDSKDLDLSCNAGMILPGTDLIAFGSKSAEIYVAHKDALGKLQPNDPQLLQQFHVGAESLESPARGYSGIQIGDTPAMASFNGQLYAAFQANDSGHALFVTSSADGVNFTSPAVGYPGILTGSAPAMTVFNNRLYIAFQANDPGHALFVTSSADGVNFTTPAVGYSGILMGSAPAMMAFNNRLYIAFQANDPGHALFVTSSTDGVNFTVPAQGYSGILIGSAPAMTAFRGQLYVSFQANDSTHTFFVTTSSTVGNAQQFNDGNRIIGLVWWQRSGSAPLLFAWPGNDTLASFPFQNGRFDTTKARYGTITGNGEPSVALSLSANGEQSGTGIVWAARTTQDRNVGSPGFLYAFNAETLQQLWSSADNPSDSIGALAKFVVPVVANGRVYMASSSGAVHVFGLR